MIKIRKTVTILMILLTFILLLTESKNGKEERYFNAPCYETADRWYNSDGLITEIHNLSTKKTVTLRIIAKQRYKNGLFLVIKRKNLSIYAFTKNKIIYSNNSEKEYVFIPIDEVIEGEEITLLLTPHKGKTGRITDTPRIQSKNDFYINLLCSQRKTILILFVINEMLVICLTKRKYRLALALFFLLLFIVTLSPLSYFVFGLTAISVCVRIVSLTYLLYFLIEHIVIALNRLIC